MFPMKLLSFAVSFFFKINFAVQQTNFEEFYIKNKCGCFISFISKTYRFTATNHTQLFLLKNYNKCTTNEQNFQIY